MAEQIRGFVDVETGEFFAENEYSLRNKKQVEGYKKRLKRELYESMTRKNWVASYHDPIKGLLNTLSMDEFGAIIKLIPHMRFNSGGKLFYGSKRMGKEEIAKSIGKSMRQTSRLLSALVKASVVQTEKEGRRIVYSISKKYHTMGDARNAPFTKLFQGFIRKKFEKLTIQQAGILYAVLPYFHYKSFLLCANPYVPDEDEADPMTAKELAEVLRIDEKTVYRHMAALSKHGIVMGYKSHGVTTYRIHPDLMFRSWYDNNDAEEFREEFNRHEVFREMVRQEFRDNERAASKHKR